MDNKVQQNKKSKLLSNLQLYKVHKISEAKKYMVSIYSNLNFFKKHENLYLPAYEVKKQIPNISEIWLKET